MRYVEARMRHNPTREAIVLQFNRRLKMFDPLPAHPATFWNALPEEHF